MLAIPVHHRLLACFDTCTQSDIKLDSRIALDHYPCESFSNIDTETIALAGKIVSFTAHHLTRRLAWLLFESSLLSPDPAELADHRQAHCFVADSEWCCNTNTSRRWIDPQVKIFYVFSHNLDLKA